MELIYFMSKYSKTYRLLVLSVAAIVALSISLPSVLLAAHCDMDMQQSPLSSMGGEYCLVMDNHSAHNTSDHSDHNQQDDNCDWSLSCACDFDQSQIKPEAVTSTTKKLAKVFVVSVVQFIDTEPTDTPSYFADTALRFHSETPPLFLLNSVFLN